MGNSADPTTWLDVLGVISPVLAAGIAVGGVIGTIFFTNRRERDRQAHEREKLEREIEERRWSTLRDERLRVYSEFVSSWEAYLRAKDTLYIGPKRTELEEAYWQFHWSFNALSLIAPEEVRAAADGVLKWSELNKEDRDPAVPGRFWKAARKDLDIPD